MDASNPSSPSARRAWNKGKLAGPKPPLRLGHVWSIRARLQLERRTRDLALFNLAIDSKQRGVTLSPFASTMWPPTATQSIEPPCVNGRPGRPVGFELIEATRRAVDDYLRASGLTPGHYLFPGHFGPHRLLATRRYARLVSQWVGGIGLDPLKYATYSMRRPMPLLGRRIRLEDQAKQEIHVAAIGSARRRLGSIGSPHLAQVPYVPSDIRFRVASICRISVISVLSMNSSAS